MTALGRTPVFILTAISCLVVSCAVFAQEPSDKLKDLWGKISKEGAVVLDQSVESLKNISEEISNALDAEIDALINSQKVDQSIEVKDKIDTIKIYVDNITALKKEEESAATFTLIGKSKKDYRIKIDEVLKEIEPVLFDGQVVNYATRIRSTRAQIKSLESEKVALNEKLVFAPEKKPLLGSSKEDLKKEIKQIDRLIGKSYKLIDELEFDLKRKLSALGIEVTRAQIRVMTTRVDGDELAKSFAIFDVTRQISTTLGELVKQNSFSGSTTVKYYGTYVIMSEILAYSQREYIRKIQDVYRPALSKIEDDIGDSIKFAEQSKRSAQSKKNRDIFDANIKSNQLSLRVLGKYNDILKLQEQSLEKALRSTNEQITVAYSTYDTAANSANLVRLINETQDSFNRIMDMQLPEIIPFENTELEMKFQEISGQILSDIET